MTMLIIKRRKIYQIVSIIEVVYSANHTNTKFFFFEMDSREKNCRIRFSSLESTHLPLQDGFFQTENKKLRKKLVVDKKQHYS
jgi:hypothetical protein